MKAHEALRLGAMTFPCVRSSYSYSDAGCLLTNMGRVVGMNLAEASVAASCAVQSARGPLVERFQILAWGVDDQHGLTEVSWQIAYRYDHGLSPDEIADWLEQVELEWEAEQPRKVEEPEAVPV